MRTLTLTMRTLTLTLTLSLTLTLTRLATDPYVAASHQTVADLLAYEEVQG